MTVSAFATVAQARAVDHTAINAIFIMGRDSAFDGGGGWFALKDPGLPSNLVTQPDLSQSPWVTFVSGAGSMTEAGGQTAPDGTSTATLLTLNRGSSGDWAIRNWNFTGTAAAYYGSIQLKASGAGDVGKKIGLSLFNGTSLVGLITVTLTSTWTTYSVSGSLAAAGCQLVVGGVSGSGDTGAIGVLAWSPNVHLGATGGLVEVDGLYLVMADGSGWARVWDGHCAEAAWFGAYPSTADIGPLFKRFPKYAEVYFATGQYTVATYPTQADFSNVFYRGHMYEWLCTGTLPAFDKTKICFNWTYTPPISGGYAGGQSAYDMTNAGLSPIEGGAILSKLDGNSGVGIAFGQKVAGQDSGNNWAIRPRNFSVGGFYINVGFIDPISNCFLTGLEKVVMKGGNIGLYLSNNGCYNSGENFIFKDCSFHNLTADACQIFSTQKVVFDGCSFDYCHRDGYLSNAYTVLKGCYLETNSTSTPAEHFAIDGGTTLVIDGDTSVLGLPLSAADFVAFDGGSARTASVHFRGAAVFNTGAKPFLNAATGNNVYGWIIGFNGNNTPPAICPDVIQGM